MPADPATNTLNRLQEWAKVRGFLKTTLGVVAGKRTEILPEQSIQWTAKLFWNGGESKTLGATVEFFNSVCSSA